MTEDITYDLTIKRYEQEVTRSQHLDSKGGTQIGFSGIMISILGFIFGAMEFEAIATSQFVPLLAVGIIILLISIGFGIIALTPVLRNTKATGGIFIPEKFYDKYDSASNDEKRKQALLAHFDLIYDYTKTNNHKALLLYGGNIAILLGLVISFIAFMLTFNILG